MSTVYIGIHLCVNMHTVDSRPNESRKQMKKEARYIESSLNGKLDKLRAFSSKLHPI